MTETYHAMICRRLGGPGVLTWEAQERRPLKPDQLRIRLAAAAANFPDMLMLRGEYQYKPELPFVPGFEGAGHVIEAGPEVRRFAVGDSVIVNLRVGAFAEEVVVPEGALMAVPRGFSMAEAAAFPVAASTAYCALVPRGRIRPGETLLVHGAGSGVGLTAVEIGHLMGARVIACASTPEKRQAALTKGADLAIDNRTSFRDAVMEATGGRGVDIAYDPVGGEIFTETLRCMARRGRLLVIGFASGTLPAAPANRVLLKDCDIVGVRAGEFGRQDPLAGRRMKEDMLALADAGHLKPLITDTMPVTEANAALQRFVDRTVAGKIVLSIPGAG
ncbi:NADPH:quinone oxidoreductase family protein [Marinibaculum pumilum]|uniref:NADPH:quinone oxidoreductase family protein n=1 Tax=Marinibaculum pumilum TaxID=1766165 RepID=A0ABV7LAK4_9PROT